MATELLKGLATARGIVEPLSSWAVTYYLPVSPHKSSPYSALWMFWQYGISEQSESEVETRMSLRPTGSERT